MNYSKSEKSKKSNTLIQKCICERKENCDMSKIVFFCIPAYGHTNPTIEVVRELVKGEIRSITIPFMNSGPVLKNRRRLHTLR